MAEDYWQTALEKIKADRIRANKIAPRNVHAPPP